MIIQDLKNSAYGQLLSRKRVFLKFLVAGGICGLLDLILLYLFTSVFGLWYLYSGIISFFIVSVFGFFLNKKITFQDARKNSPNQYVKYIIVILIGMIINNIFLFVLTGVFAVWYIASRIFSSLIALIWNYYGNRRFIFSGAEERVLSN